MSHPLQQKIAALRSRTRRLVVVHGVSWVIAAVTVAVIVLGSSDYLIGLQDRGIRVIWSLGLAGALGWTCYRFVYLPALARLGDVDLAARLQRRFPALEDRLTSTVEFLGQAEDDPVAGSAALRRAVIAQTTAETERLDFGDVLDRRPPLRAALVSAAVCLVAAILVALQPGLSQTAVARLVNPFGNTAWPQKNHLMICLPIVDRVARGQPFQIEVVDELGRRLPEEVRIHYRFEDSEGDVSEETQPMRLIDAAAAVRGEKGDRARMRKQGVMVARRENVTREFSYFVEGGDDRRMVQNPIFVEVVEPPGLESLRIKLVPPSYSGLPAEESGTSIRALADTQIEITATATRPLSWAVIRLNGSRQGGWSRQIDAGPTDAGPTDRPGQHIAAGFRVDKEFPVDGPIQWRFELTDQQQLVGGRDVHGEIRVVPDSPPSVSIESPSGDLFVTPRAVVPLRVVATDDLAVRVLTLVFGRSDPSQPDPPKEDVSKVPIYTGPQQVEPRPPGALSGSAELGQRLPVEHRWELAELGLAPGSRLDFHVAATDYARQTGTSQPRRLIVITPEELQQRLADRQGRILAELAKVLKMQRDSRSQVQSLQIRLDEIGRLEQLDVDHLQAAELGQRQVKHRLTDHSDGVSKLVVALLADLENNRVNSPDVKRRMETLLAEVRRLRREHLPVIELKLTDAIKAARVGLQEESAPSKPDTRAAASLADAGTHQDTVIASLEALLGEMTQWDNYRRFYREISQLLRDQRELARRSSELGRHTVTKDLRDLRPQQRADLKVLAQRQLELARRLQRIQQQMELTCDELQQSDPLAAETIADALAEARRLAISGQMRACSGYLGRNQIGQTARAQKQIALDLQEVLDLLANRRGHELVRLIGKLRQAEADLAELYRQQAALRKQMEDAARAPEPDRRRLERLGRQQQQLQKTTQQTARRLKRLLADQASRTTDRAAAEMGRAAAAAASGEGPAATEAAQDAQNSLEEAQRQLTQRRLEAESELAAEQIAQLKEALEHLKTGQQDVIAETGRFDDLLARGTLSRAQAAGLDDLARRQQTLQTETVELADALVSSRAFHLALSGAAGHMGQAAGRLKRQQTGEITQRAENNALARLELLIEALKPEPPIAEPGDGGGGGGDGGDAGGATGGQAGNAALVRLMAELKLLKLLQQEVNLRTGQLQHDAGADPLSAEQLRQFDSLSKEQGQLADLTLQLIQPQPQAPEDDPAALPDPRLKPDRPHRPTLPPLEEDLP